MARRRRRLTPRRPALLAASTAPAVRNAVDHGIEPPDQRVAAGKPAAGQLVLSCRQSPTELGMGALREVCWALGGTVHVESDPGRGTRLTCLVPYVL